MTYDDIEAYARERARRSSRIFSDNPDLSSLQYHHGDIDGAVLYASALIPKTVVASDRVFLVDAYTDEEIRSEAAAAQSTQALQDLETKFNFLEAHVRFSSSYRYEIEDFVFLANMLRHFFACQLREDYPDRKFVVETVDAEYEGFRTAVRFFEVPNVDATGST